MSSFVKVASAGDIASGTGTCVEVAGRQIALFNVDGTFYAIDNTCPHRGGPLAEGELEGAAVTCPWHAWQFDLKTGESLTDDSRVERYDVQLVDGEVLIAAG